MMNEGELSPATELGEGELKNEKSREVLLVVVTLPLLPLRLVNLWADITPPSFLLVPLIIPMLSTVGRRDDVERLRDCVEALESNENDAAFRGVIGCSFSSSSPSSDNCMG